MGYPQQPQNDPNQYPQQPGYPQSPTPGSPSIGTMNFSAITAPENRNYLIAGVGALVAFLGYFILPFYSVSIPAITGITSASTTSTSGSGLAAGYGLMNFVWLAALVGLAAAAYAALDIKAVATLTPQILTRIILVAGAVVVVVLVITLLQVNSTTSGLSGLSILGSGYSYGVAFGFWIAILAGIAMIVGGVMSFRKTA